MLQGLDEEDLGPDRKYPPILPIVLYNGERRWNAPVDVRGLFAPVPEELLGYLPRHRYFLIGLRELDLSLLPRENVLSMIAGLEQARSLEQFEKFLVPLAEWLERVRDPDLLASFRAWVTLVLAPRVGSAEQTLELDVRRKEEAKMTTLIERVRKWSEERDQHWLEKGRVEGERELVYRLVARRFGAGAAGQLAPLLDGMLDPARIAVVADAVVECETAEEFIARAKKVAETP